MLENIRIQSESLDKIIKENNEEYLGTDPVEDAKKIYREKKKKQYGIFEDKNGFLHEKDPMEFN